MQSGTTTTTTTSSSSKSSSKNSSSTSKSSSSSCCCKQTKSTHELPLYSHMTSDVIMPLCHSIMQIFYHPSYNLMNILL